MTSRDALRMRMRLSGLVRRNSLGNIVFCEMSCRHGKGLRTWPQWECCGAGRGERERERMDGGLVMLVMLDGRGCGG
jgi:hypothetical protein